VTDRAERETDAVHGSLDGVHDTTHEMDRGVLPTGELPALIRTESASKPRIRPIRLTIKALLFVVIAVFLLPPVLGGFRQAIQTARDVNPGLLAAGFALQILALFSYSLLTRATLGTAGRQLSMARMFRIQLSTKALSNIVPGGNAASSALGYRLLTLSGISGPDAGFALAMAGIGSAVVLNVIFWTGLIMSIPFRGVNEAYSLAAVAGIIIIGVAGGLVVGIMDGSGRAERLVRWIARRFRTDEDKFAAALHQVAERLEELIRDRPLLRKVVFWAMANWLLDAASLWVFVQAFGGTLSLDALLVAFGLANVLAAIPILPGGLGVVDATYLTTLVGFGIPRRVVVAAIGTYRLAQYLMPIALGALAYASLRVGPWKIEKRDRLVGLRDLARAESEKGESRLDFALRFGSRRPTADEADDPALQAVMKPDPEPSKDDD
jgi:uncharacterized protein (TIRG00374 family)